MAEIDEAFKKMISIAMFDIANDLRNELVRVCPADTGILRNSIEVRPEGMTLIISMVRYGEYVEYGTSPHLILPTKKKALAFKVEGKKIVVKKVSHPGTRPNPFIRSTIHTKLPGIIQNRLG